LKIRAFSGIAYSILIGIFCISSENETGPVNFGNGSVGYWEWVRLPVQRRKKNTDFYLSKPQTHENGTIQARNNCFLFTSFFFGKLSAPYWKLLNCCRLKVSLLVRSQYSNILHVNNTRKGQ
jgi:hypothetical protein